ncbi:hypothetical protein N431DRAFT_425524 [Stipitochalara longipes BDJ]|nr:hypothetical protein N431DRAFT_425524 [Stipitochalara longipes BDJ]
MAPLQPPKILRIFSFVLHVLGLVSFTLSFKYLFSLSTKLSQSFGGYFQQLTILCLLFSTLTFAVGLLADIINSRLILRGKIWLLSFTTPMELILTTTYWLLLFYNPALIIDTRTAGQPPPLADMGFHLFPAIFLCLDSSLTSPLRISKRSGLVVSAGIIGCYWGWVVVCESRNGYWIYPIIGRLGNAERAAAGILWIEAVWGVWCAAEGLKGWMEDRDRGNERVERKTR